MVGGGGHVWWGACMAGGHVLWGEHAWPGGMDGWGACMVGGHAWLGGGMHGRGCAWMGACMVGGMHGGDHAWWGHAWLGGMHGQWACVAEGEGVCMAGGHAWQWACMTCMPPPRQTLRLCRMVNEQAVRILLECILIAQELRPGVSIGISIFVFWGGIGRGVKGCSNSVIVTNGLCGIQCKCSHHAITKLH